MGGHNANTWIEFDIEGVYRYFLSPIMSHSLNYTHSIILFTFCVYQGNNHQANNSSCVVFLSSFAE